MASEEIRKIIGQRVRHYRKINNLTQKQLTEEIGGVSSKYIGNIEAGQKGVSLEKIIEICQFFNIVVSDLIPIKTRDDTEEREKIVLDISNMVKALDTNNMKVVRSMIAGVADNPCTE